MQAKNMLMLYSVIVIVLITADADAGKESYGRQALPQKGVYQNTTNPVPQMESISSQPASHNMYDKEWTTNKVLSMTFLVTVNLTWGSCIKTVKTPPLKPNQNWNETEAIVVGKCDKGPLTYKIISPDTTTAGTVVEVTFYTTAIGVQPPSCRIAWDYGYIEPTNQSATDSPLPGCFINDSQEGYHVTSYWLHILDWELDE